MAFVPFNNNTGTSQLGMMRFPSIFTWQREWNIGSTAGGIAYASNTAIAVRMEENDLHHFTS